MRVHLMDVVLAVPAVAGGCRLAWATPSVRPARTSGRDEARGNPVRVRDCPAAVSGNDRRHDALGVSLGSTASRSADLSEVPRRTVEDRHARESEDLPSMRAPPAHAGERPLGTADWMARHMVHAVFEPLSSAVSPQARSRGESSGPA
jgi:hypothetical protein